MAHKPQPPKQQSMPPIGRDARTGQFVPVDYARSHPSTTVVEHNKKPK